jgi:hypothetical protein
MSNKIDYSDVLKELIKPDPHKFDPSISNALAEVWDTDELRMVLTDKELERVEAAEKRIHESAFEPKVTKTKIIDQNFPPEDTRYIMIEATNGLYVTHKDLQCKYNYGICYDSDHQYFEGFEYIGTGKDGIPILSLIT